MSKKVNYFIFALAVIGAFGLFVTSGAPIIQSLVDSKIAPVLYALSYPNTIAFNLLIGYLTSTFFWFLVVYIPEKSRRRLLRATLANRYMEFKQEIIQILIWASGESKDLDYVNELACDHIKFKRHFNKDKWHAALNGIQSDKFHIKSLMLAMKIFSNEVEYVLNNVSIDDPTIHQVLKRLNENIIRLQEAEVDEYTKVRHVEAFLWQILARWNIIEGQLEEDIIKKMISRI